MELVHRKQSRFTGRMTWESILSRTTPVVEKWIDGAQQGEGMVDGAGTVEDFLRDQQILLDFVENGVEILVDPEFEVNQEGGKLSKKYIDAAPAVDAMEYESWQKGLAIVLPEEKVAGCKGRPSR